MNFIAITLTAMVTIEHIYILWMEMFAWETAGKKTFGKSLPHNLFKPTKGLAANQGLYNGFLVAGLVWSFLIDNSDWSFNVRMFFLGCVMVAGIFGALTASKKIFVIQGVPVILAMIFLYLAK